MIGFGEFGLKRKLEIRDLDDERLIKINPLCEGFYDKVLGFMSQNQEIVEFKKAVREIEKIGVKPFWRPFCDPTIDEDEEVFYEKGMKPAEGYSYNDWEKLISKIHRVGKYKWAIGSEYQYYAFLVWLINELVEDNYYKIEAAIEAIVIDSKEIGHYVNSMGAIKSEERTRSSNVCGVYDIANTFKILSCTNEENGFWIAGGAYYHNGTNCPVADLNYHNQKNKVFGASVAWLVLN